MYFCLRKVFSSSFRCSSENTALLRIPLRDLGLISADHIRIFAPSDTKNRKKKYINVGVMVWPKLLCQHLNWFLVVSCGLFLSGPCASCYNPKNKCNLIWKQVKRVQIEAQKHKIILSTITMYFTNHTTFPTFSSQDHACFCHTHFITHFQSFFSSIYPI